MLRSHLRSGKAHGAILWSPKTLEWAPYILVSQKKENQSHTQRVSLGRLNMRNGNMAEWCRGSKK